MKFALATLAAFSALTVGSAWAEEPFPSASFVPIWIQAPSNGVPFVRLDKTVFASGESVFFWTGVEAVHQAAIPKEYWSTCRLRVTRPDGTQKDEPVGWPTDGPVELGWMGGSGLGEKPEPGRYRIVFEFGGQKTAPVSLVVEDLPLLKQITAEFVFGARTMGPNGWDTPVTLTVHNGTSQTLRFPHRDGVNGLVSYSLTLNDGQFHSNGFYPLDQLRDKDEPDGPNRTVDKFTWKDAKEIPTITVLPGETYTQTLSLRAVLAEANKNGRWTGNSSLPAGHYKVTFSTTLAMLIGEAGGEFADVSPVRIPVASTLQNAILSQ